MRLVYIAGPYYSPTFGGIERNIDNARAAAEITLAGGDYPFTPHLNTGGMDGIQSEEFIKAGALRILSMCSRVLLVGYWETSVGTLEEILEALDLGIEVIDSEHPERIQITKGDRLHIANMLLEAKRARAAHAQVID